MSRRIFNRLHIELSLLAGKNIPRMELWEEVGEHYDPRNLTKERALQFLTDKLGADSTVVKAFRRWDPNKETPEETMERLCRTG
jgi:hypothetical protein